MDDAAEDAAIILALRSSVDHRKMRLDCLPLLIVKPEIVRHESSPPDELESQRDLQFNWVQTLAVIFLGIFGYFYLHSREKVEVSQTQNSSVSSLPSAEPAQSTLPSAQLSLSTAVPGKAPQRLTVVNPSTVSQDRERAATPLPRTTRSP